MGTQMKKILTLSAFFVLLAGCNVVNFFHSDSHLYEIQMMNGDILYARSKPKLSSDNYYRFSDINNQRYAVNKNLVLYIEPAKVKQ